MNRRYPLPLFPPDPRIAHILPILHAIFDSARQLALVCYLRLMNAICIPFDEPLT